MITFSCAYAYAFTAPSMIKDLTRYGNTLVGFIVATISLSVAVAILVNGMAASHKASPYLHIVIPASLMSLGCLGVGLFHTPVLVICSLALLPIFHNASFGPLFAIAASFLDKKGAAGGLAFVNAIGVVGGFLGPYYIGLAKDLTGSYQRGFLALSVPCVFAVFLVLHLRRNATVVAQVVDPTTSLTRAV